ncbi:MAG: hypothetical protein H0W70_11410, partial [Actinobacteria bacterium]|nr:hypothetical protein [Actinomycetota bacterium]
SRLGPGGVIDAKVGRQFAEGDDVARSLRAQGRLGQVVIVHLGTNGPPRASDIDSLMRELDGVPRVLLVNVRMPRKWEGATNAALQDATHRYPKTVLVDWHGHSNSHPDWFQSDGVHLTRRGADAFAALIAESLPPPPPPPPPTTTTEPPPPPPPESTTTTAPIPVG